MDNNLEIEIEYKDGRTETIPFSGCISEAIEEMDSILRNDRESVSGTVRKPRDK